MSTDRGRRYAGADPDERRARRRSDLIDAGLELFGTDGFPPTSVKAICDRAGLTQRYFYESFADRAALLGAVYDHCVEVARTATLAASTPFLRAGRDGLPAEQIPAAAGAILGAFIDTLAGDRRVARVILVEIVGVSPELERKRQLAIHGWAQLILVLVGGDTPTSKIQRLAAIGLVGAVTQLLVDWHTSTTDTRDSGTGATEPGTAELAPEEFDVASIHESCVEIFVATYHSLFA